MVDIFKVQIKLVFVMLPITAIFRTTIGENAQQGNFMLIEEWNYLVIEHIGCDQCIFTVIELGKCHLGISIDEGLLIDPADALQIPHVKGILCTKIARMFGFNLSFGFLRFFGFFQRLELGFGQNHPLLGNLGFQRI